MRTLDVTSAADGLEFFTVSDSFTGVIVSSAFVRIRVSAWTGAKWHCGVCPPGGSLLPYWEPFERCLARLKVGSFGIAGLNDCNQSQATISHLPLCSDCCCSMRGGDLTLAGTKQTLENMIGACRVTRESVSHVGGEGSTASTPPKFFVNQAFGNVQCCDSQVNSHGAELSLGRLLFGIRTVGVARGARLSHRRRSYLRPR